MIDIATIVISITALFVLFVGARAVFSLNVCALCAAVSLTWIILLGLSYTDYPVDPVAVGILMGGSVVGTMYTLERKVPERIQMFKLPFLATGIVAAYFLIVQHITIEATGIVALLWVGAGAIYVGRNTPSVKTIGQNIIECCKDW